MRSAPREVDVIGHVRGLLRRGPVLQVVGEAGVTEVAKKRFASIG